jgi:hypothetical protein
MKGFSFTIDAGFKYIARNMVRSMGYEIRYRDLSTKEVFILEIFLTIKTNTR